MTGLDGEKISLNIKTVIATVFGVASLIGIWYSAKYQIDNNTKDIEILQIADKETKASIKELPDKIGAIIDQKLSSSLNEFLLKIDERYEKKKLQ